MNNIVSVHLIDRDDNHLTIEIEDFSTVKQIIDLCNQKHKTKIEVVYNQYYQIIPHSYRVQKSDLELFY